jgi:acyl-CoA thioesterase FadM
MENIQIVEVENAAGELVEHVIIDRGNGEYTSMPKAVWDELEAAKENGTIS